MKIVTTKENLTKALKVANISVSGSGEDMEAHYLFRHRDGKTEILGKNVRILGSVLLECEVEGVSDTEEENRFTVEAERLKSWLSAVASGKVSLRLSKGKVVAQVSRGRVTFRSMDPARFPYWDKRFSEAKFTGKLPSKRLHRVLKHTRMFISKNEEQDPEICSCEFMEGGSLYATDSASATNVLVAGMENVTARFTGRKDVNSFLKFLEAHPEDDIEFLEHPQCLFLQTSSGSILGQRRSRLEFPEIDLGEAFDDAQHWWTFDRAEMLSAINFLTPSAVRDHFQMYIELDGVGNLNLALSSAAGGKVDLPVTCQEQKMADGASPLPEGGFPVSYAYLRDVLKSLEEESITMAVSQLHDEDGSPAGGYCSFKQEIDGDMYLVVLGWYEEA